MKALVATGLGVMALGGVLLANSGCSTAATPAVLANQSTDRAPLVDCGEGRQAMIPADSGGSLVPRVTCVALPELARAGATPRLASPVAQERVIYRDREAAPVRTASSRPASRTRTWKKSAIIIGGSTAAGAGVGAVLDGKSGAKKGAVVGLLGGTIYDLATRTGS